MQPRNYDMIKFLRPIWKASTDTFYTIDAVAHHNCQTNAMVIHHAQTRLPIRSMGPHFGSSSGVRRYRAADLRRPRVYRTAAFGMAQPFHRPFGQCGPRHDPEAVVAFDPRYLEQKRQFAPQITAAAAEIRDHEERGQSLPCSTQIYLEAKWLLNSTAFFDELNGMLDSFRDSLKTEDQRFANQQSAADGGWGACFKRKFKRLGA